MINLSTGSNTIWLSLRESIPYGATSTDYKFTFTHDLSKVKKVCYPTDLQPDNKWSVFNITVGPTESFTSSVTLDMRPGMWSYKVELGTTTLEMGKVLVDETWDWTTLDRPIKTTTVLKRD
jgi:hypothetical protein